MKSYKDYYHEGQDAFFAGKLESTNPYLVGTAPYYNWLRGYDDAAEISEGVLD